ncbi:MAG: universal stress protein [Pirellulales bacterium]|nr:universal stress protein [Pirellulales bacterium]
MSWLPKDKVVVPVDFSEASSAAVDAALSLVADPSHVYIVNVLAVLEPAEPGVIWNTVDDAARKHHVELALTERFADTRYQGLRFEVAFGDPGHEIAGYAERIAADLIVMPSHGRTGLSRLLVGSVAERVVRLAHCPVLVLKR